MIKKVKFKKFFKKFFKRYSKPMSKKEFQELIAGLTDEEQIKVYDWLLIRQ